MARSKSSSRWLQRQKDDPYVLRAQKEGWRSRAVYKLQEVDEKYKLLKPGQIVVDLGSAPGAWSQWIAHKLDQRVRIIALDILPMDGLAGVEFIQGDFTEDIVLDKLIESLEGQAVDIVFSDMAPNISGVRAVDQPKSMYLAELAYDFAVNHLKLEGALVVKLFQGEGYSEYLKSLRSRFETVNSFKPRASRADSREMYSVARGFKM